MSDDSSKPEAVSSRPLEDEDLDILVGQGGRYERAAAEIHELREKAARPFLRYWYCPCGDLVIRDEHYDLECGKCQRVMVDADELVPDVEMHRLWADNAKLRKTLQRTERLLQIAVDDAREAVFKRKLVENDNAKLRDLARGNASIMYLRGAVEELEAANAKLRAALKKYGQHASLCQRTVALTIPRARICTCGLEAALAAGGKRSAVSDQQSARSPEPEATQPEAPAKEQP